MNHHFPFPVAVLTYNGNLIVAAAQAHPELAPRLPANFVTDTGTLLGKITADVTSQKTKKGDLGNLTATQHDALEKLQSWMTKARKTASLAFKGQDVQLHQQFQVGVHQPHDLASILNRADIILAGLQNAANLPALQLKGWTAADTTAFLAVRNVFPASTQTQQSGKSDAKDATTLKNADANTLYDNLLTIQNAADLQWPPEDLANAGVRDEFRLNTFPPAGGNGNGTPAPATPPATPHP